MSDTDSSSFRVTPTACDLAQLTTWFGPPRTDDDGDGYFVGEDDCDDANSQIFSGAPNPLCGYMLQTGIDYNCDGTPDDQQNYYDICPASPILIDTGGNGFSLTNRAGGVAFDLANIGRRDQIPWTSIGSDDSWLALDRNGNGTIDSGAELFGNYTDQPAVDDPNGFAALAVFDTPAAGGNGDGWIDASDSIFLRLRLWRDANHDGVSQRDELRSLPAVGLRRISLTFRQLSRTDEWGNWFRYGARIVDARNRDIGVWAYDVFLGGKPKGNRR